jgi:hypothetical protein
MKALSIHQPWASLIVHGIKTVENRKWRTNHRGPLLIHAGRKLGRDNPHPGVQADDYGLIGSVELVDCVRDHRSPWALEAHWHWILVNPRRFPRPVHWLGRLGLFDVPTSALRQSS